MNDHIDTVTFGLCLAFGGEDELLHDPGQRSAVWFCARGQVFCKLYIKRACLSTRPMKSSIGIEVRKCGDKLLLHCDSPDQIEEEGFSAAILADNKPECRSSVGDAFQVLDQALDFVRAADLNQMLADARNDARPQGLNQRVSISGADYAHAISLETKSEFTSIGSSPSRMAHSSRSKAASLIRSMAPSVINPWSAQSSSISARDH